MGFPAVLRHCYNLLCLSVRDVDRKAVVLNPTTGVAVAAVPVEEGVEGELEPVGKEGDSDYVEPPVEEKTRSVPPLEVKEHGSSKIVKHPVTPKE